MTFRRSRVRRLEGDEERVAALADGIDGRQIVLWHSPARRSFVARSTGGAEVLVSYEEARRFADAITERIGPEPARMALFIDALKLEDDDGLAR